MPSLGEGKALCTETKGSASSDSHVLLTGSFWHLISPSGSHRLDTTARPKSKSHYIFYPFLCQLLPFSQVTVHVSHLNPDKVLFLTFSVLSIISKISCILVCFFFSPLNTSPLPTVVKTLSSLYVLAIIFFISFLYAIIKGQWWVSCTEI